ncbi:MAG TPA: nucleotide exchange factor GrpE [Clostridiales bacterium]|jgi:molecular chaperone GrpE|nr:nucleotide exchange factor GrpE [Clostridiales bacterium]HBR08733.1 nucleotide exchange factor GrpE [Clostridiales bacterium]
MSSKKNDRKPEEETPEIKTDEQNVDAEQTPADKTETPTAPTKPSFEAELKAEKDKYLRLMAEYDNYRKRSARERENIYTDLLCDTITKFLPVYDNLVRALEQPTEDAAYSKGVEMIMSQFRETLTCFGVTEIEALGKKFDPLLHEAVFHEKDETKGEGEIVQELCRGFKLGDRVIRFAMVKVAN